VRSTLADPVTRSSAFLMASSVGAGLLTFAFWTIVARHTTPATVGGASAELAAVTFLASVGSLNMLNVFARFLPEAGSYSRRFVVTGYVAAGASTLVVATAFVATPWGDRLIVGGAASRVFFVILVVATGIFLVQDGGLIGLGRAALVPVENVLVACGRLLLAVTALTAGDAGRIVVAWAVPLILAVVTVNTLILSRWSREHRDQPPLLPSRRLLGTFVAVESVTTAVAAVLWAFFPAIVLQFMGAEAAGLFYVPWLIVTTAFLLLTSILISMVREVVARPGEAAAIIHRSLWLSGGLALGAGLGCVFLGPLLLAVMGPAYAEGSGPLVMWIGLSIPPSAVVLVYWAVCLIRRAAWPMLAVNVAVTSLTIGGIALTGTREIGTVGELYCAVQWAVAFAVSWPTVRRLRSLMVPAGATP
jgi:O-antigen/teichoic acid export membrane protein